MFKGACSSLVKSNDKNVKNNLWLFKSSIEGIEIDFIQFKVLNEFDKEDFSYIRKKELLDKIMKSISDIVVLATGEYPPSPDNINDYLYSLIVYTEPRRMYSAYKYCKPSFLIFRFLLFFPPNADEDPSIRKLQEIFETIMHDFFVFPS